MRNSRTPWRGCTLTSFTLATASYFPLLPYPHVPRITMLVLPLPTTAARPQTPAPQKKADPPKLTGGQAPPNKKRKLTRAENCPEELKKYNLRLEGKGNICWNYNLAVGCSNSASGHSCKVHARLPRLCSLPQVWA